MLIQSLAADEWSLTLLINFQLIASGQPFPYETLAHYDFVIFSPIENKGCYNTSELRRHCLSVGCRTISFPWLEWHGYCPGAQKGFFKGRFQWHYPQLMTLAAEFSSLEHFHDHVLAKVPNDQTIMFTVELSTGMIRSAEMRNETDVRVADFITDRFRSSRLFMISDHPSLLLYRHVLDQILDAMDIPSVVDATIFIDEPQWHVRTPILPRVANYLGLDFQDTEWFDHDLLPGLKVGLRTYLALYYHSDSVIMAPRTQADLFETGHGITHGVPISGQTRLIAKPVRERLACDDRAAERMADVETLEEYELLESLPGGMPALPSSGRFAIRPEEWTFG